MCYFLTMRLIGQVEHNQPGQCPISLQDWREVSKMAEEPISKRSKSEEKSVAVFREYLRIKTVQPNPDYGLYAQVLNQFVSKRSGKI